MRRIKFDVINTNSFLKAIMKKEILKLKGVKVHFPVKAGIFKARDKPRAAATETLTPVKFPGPMPTPIEDT